MTTLQQIEALNEATQILREAHSQCTSDSMAIWGILVDAGRYIDKQITELLSDQVVQP